MMILVIMIMMIMIMRMIIMADDDYNNYNSKINNDFDNYFG